MSPLYTASFAGLEVKKIKCSSNRIKLDGSKFEPSIYYLLESRDLIFFTKNLILETFFASSPARLAVYIEDTSSLYTASFAGLELKKS